MSQIELQPMQINTRQRCSLHTASLQSKLSDIVNKTSGLDDSPSNRTNFREGVGDAHIRLQTCHVCRWRTLWTFMNTFIRQN